MARTIQDIKAQMVAKKNSIPEIAEMNTDGNVARGGLFFYIVAVAIWSQEKLWDIFRIEVDDHIARSRVHTLRWYRDRVLEFRDGKDLNWSDGVFSYPELLPSEDLEDLEIIDQAAVVEAPNELLVKIATGQGGVLQPVTAAQEFRVQTYMDEIKDAGNNIRIVNLLPDELEIEAIIYVDGLVINLSDGSLISDPSTIPAEIALSNYINQENDINFNGELRRNHLIDEIQKSQGTVDLHITSLRARYGTLPFEEVPVSYLPNSGYFTISSISFQYQTL